MRIKNLAECELIIANDLTQLRELYNPLVDGWPVGYSLAHAVVPAGQRSIRHHLVGSSEVYYILEGRGRMHIDDEQREVGPGDAILIPDGAVQFLENTGDIPMVFLAIVEPAWRPEIDVRDEDAG